MGRGEGIIAMQYLRSLVPEWLWSAQDFPFPSHTLSSKGSVFPVAELYLGFSGARSYSFSSLPYPDKKPGSHRPGNS